MRSYKCSLEASIEGSYRQWEMKVNLHPVMLSFECILDLIDGPLSESENPSTLVEGFYKKLR